MQEINIVADFQSAIGFTRYTTQDGVAYHFIPAFRKPCFCYQNFCFSCHQRNNITKIRDFSSNYRHFEPAVRDFILFFEILSWFTEIVGWFMEIQSQSFMILFAFST